MDLQLERLMRLIKKTGDRLVILDPKSGDPLVLMGIEEYEKLVGFSDDLPIGHHMPSIGDILREQTQGGSYVMDEAKLQEEFESVPGMQTEIVEIQNEQKEENTHNNQNFYFEDVENDQEKEKKEDNLSD